MDMLGIVVYSVCLDEYQPGKDCDRKARSTYISQWFNAGETSITLKLPCRHLFTDQLSCSSEIRIF